MITHAPGASLTRTTIDGRLVLAGPPGTSYVLLNDLQSEVWSLAHDAPSVAEVHRRLLARGVAAPAARVEQFVTDLHRRGLLAIDGTRPQPTQRKLRFDPARLSWNAEFDVPPRARVALHRIGQSWLLSRPSITVLAVAVAAATASWIISGTAAVHRSLATSSVGWAGAFYTSIISIAVLHELGHALALSRFTDPPYRVGILGRYLVFVGPFVKTKHAWAVPKMQRATIALAGVAVNAVIGAALGVAAQLPLPSDVSKFCSTLAAISWGAGLFNLLPFLVRTDGHYLLSDLLNTRNWRLLALDHARASLRHKTLPPPHIAAIQVLACVNVMFFAMLIAHATSALATRLLAVPAAYLIAAAVTGRAAHLAYRDARAPRWAATTATLLMVGVFAVGSRWTYPRLASAVGAPAAVLFAIVAGVICGVVLSHVAPRSQAGMAVHAMVARGSGVLTAVCASVTIAAALSLETVPTLIAAGTAGFSARRAVRPQQQKLFGVVASALIVIVATVVLGPLPHAEAAQIASDAPTLAIISTGFTPLSATNNIVGWWDFTKSEPQPGQTWDPMVAPTDDSGAGTNALRAASTTLREGARIAVARVCTSAGCPGSIAQAVRWATDTMQASVIAIPMYYVGTAPSALAYIDEAVAYAHAHGRLVIVATGGPPTAVGAAIAGPHPFGTSATSLVAGTASGGISGSRDPDLVVDEASIWRADCTTCPASLHYGHGATLRNAPAIAAIAGEALAMLKTGVAEHSDLRAHVEACVDDTMLPPPSEGMGTVTLSLARACSAGVQPAARPQPDLSRSYLEFTAHPTHDAWTDGLDRGISRTVALGITPNTHGVIGVSAPEGPAEQESYSVDADASEWITIAIGLGVEDPNAAAEVRVLDTHRPTDPLLHRGTVTAGADMTFSLRAPAPGTFVVQVIGSIITSPVTYRASIVTAGAGGEPAIAARTEAQYEGDELIAWTTT